jgi:hypothetical protein
MTGKQFSDAQMSQNYTVEMLQILQTTEYFEEDIKILKPHVARYMTIDDESKFVDLHVETKVDDAIRGNYSFKMGAN